MEENLITLKNVNKKYRKVCALQDVNLTLKKGKIYGLVGKNGAGKTTMMRIIAGLAYPSDGGVEVIFKRCGMLIEAPGLNGDMSAGQNLKFYRMLYSDEARDGQTDEDILDMVGLKDTGKKKVKDFSLGMRQRLGIAVALLANPDFVMLDEPVNGLDPVGVVEIRKLIHKLNEERGMTILISSHNLPELYQTATDYIILDKGRIRKEVTQEQLEKEAEGNLEEYFLKCI